MIAAGYISKEEATGQFDDFWRTYLESVRTKFQTLGVRSRSYDRAPHFTEYIRRILVERYGEKLVYHGGLNIYTTLDIRHQKAAEEALIKGIEEQDRIAREQNGGRLDYYDRIMVRKQQEEKKTAIRDVEQRVQFLSSLRNGPLYDVLMMTMVSGNYRR